MAGIFHPIFLPPPPVVNVVGHTSFYSKVDLAKYEALYKDRTPGSDPVEGGLSKGNIVETDLENKSQNTQPILTL